MGSGDQSAEAKAQRAAQLQARWIALGPDLYQVDEDYFVVTLVYAEAMAAHRAKPPSESED
jgi:hypothetical protein